MGIVYYIITKYLVIKKIENSMSNGDGNLKYYQNPTHFHPYFHVIYSILGKNEKLD